MNTEPFRYKPHYLLSKNVKLKYNTNSIYPANIENANCIAPIVFPAEVPKRASKIEVCNTIGDS